MGSVDVAYQLRMQYRTDNLMRNRKYLWSIFIWVLGLYVMNAYLVYREIIRLSKRNKMYRVPNEISRVQFLESLSSHLMTFNKSKLQRLRN